MKTIVALLILFTLFSVYTYAQDYTQLGLPDGAKARLGKGSVSDIQYSPDGTLLAVGGSLGIWLYDTHTGAEVGLLAGDTAGIISVSFSPDGSTLASGSWGKVVRLWDVSTGELIRTFEGHASGVISFSPDGQILASGGSKMVSLWDVSTGELIQTFESEEPNTWFSSVSFSPDGLTLAGSDGYRTFLWDVSTGEMIQSLLSLERPLSTHSILFSPRWTHTGKWDSGRHDCPVGRVYWGNDTNL